MSMGLPPSVYLCGPIRDEYHEDIVWREKFIHDVGDNAIVYNPLAGHTFNHAQSVWSQHGVPVSSSLIVKQDLWMVDHADILVANLLPLADEYPCLGSLMEIGRASAHGALVFAAIPDGFGRIVEMLQAHPFVTELIARRFHDIESMTAFVTSTVLSISGEVAKFGGYE